MHLAEIQIYKETPHCSKILSDYLLKVNKLSIHANQTIREHSSERLEGDCASMKPDLWWWEGNHLFIAEFTYGQMSTVDGEQQSTLMILRREKLDIYKTFVEECKRQLHTDFQTLTQKCVNPKTKIVFLCDFFGLEVYI